MYTLQHLEFTETMRLLRYPVLISIDSFKTPNFELVADILYWMAQRYDPNIHIHASIDSEKDRVQFITGIVAALHEKSNIQLNARKLYASDGHAARELLKLARSLLNAVQAENHYRKHSREAHRKEPITLCMEDIRSLRSLATKVTESGARLYSLLTTETEAKKEREKVSTFLEAATSSFGPSSELETIEQSLNEQLEEVTRNFASIEDDFIHIEADKNDLLADIKKKSEDLDRNNKRLESLEMTRPAFMDEFEEVEIELQKQYELYMERYRNIHYLKHELDLVEKDEKEKLLEAKRTMKRLQAKVREDELKMLGGNNESSDAGKGEALSEDKIMSTPPQGPLEQSGDLNDSDESTHIVLEDDSSTEKSSILMISRSSADQINEVDEGSSSESSMSVDSETYFMQSDDNGSDANSSTSSENNF